MPPARRPPYDGEDRSFTLEEIYRLRRLIPALEEIVDQEERRGFLWKQIRRWVGGLLAFAVGLATFQEKLAQLVSYMRGLFLGR